jgi:hypothetical protein
MHVLAGTRRSLALDSGASCKAATRAFDRTLQRYSGIGSNSLAAAFSQNLGAEIKYSREISRKR